MLDLQRYPDNRYLVDNLESITVFLASKMFNSDNFRFVFAAKLRISLLKKSQNILFTQSFQGYRCDSKIPLFK